MASNPVGVKISELPELTTFNASGLVEVSLNSQSRHMKLSKLLTAGPDGKSAYQLAVDGGYTGTQTQWLNSLKGVKGDKGDKGDKGNKGDPGTNGNDGKSAYQLAVQNGYSGTESQWITSLKGAKGDKGNKGDPGTNGNDGKSAYQVAIDNGFTGTSVEWLDSLKVPQSVLDSKADKSYVDTELNKKADKTQLNSKADKTYVDNQLNTKASKVYVDGEIAALADLINNIDTGIEEAPLDGEKYVRTNGSWLIAPDASLPAGSTPGNYWMTINGWKMQQDYDLKITTITEDTTIDVENQGIWNVVLGEDDINIIIPNYTKVGRTKTIVFIVHGNDGILTFGNRVNWGEEGTPILGDGFTVITMLWDGSYNQWIASLGGLGMNLTN